MLRSKYRAIGLLFVLALVFALVPVAAFAAQGISGVIKDGTTGYPIPFAFASLESSLGAPLDAVQAAYDGTYSFETDVDTFTVYADAGSYVGTRTVEFKVEEGAVSSQDIVLDRSDTFWQPIYRFFNMTGGVHFYTADNSEFINVYKNLPMYKYDGIGYSVPEGDDVDPVYITDINDPGYPQNSPGWMNMNDDVLQRFFNKQTGVHFYTADNAEYLNVKNNLQAIYRYDGPAYNVRLTDLAMFGPVGQSELTNKGRFSPSLPIFRFYNGTTNAHFYTANLSEINGGASLAGTFKFEGTAFYTGGWRETWLREYQAGDNGTITGEARQIILNGGDGTVVEAVPDDGYEFVQWSDTITENPRTDLSVSSNASVTAEFQLIP
ncbi:MAG: hypothetical protein WCJ13_08760 [Coriobacteriia bacterium]